MPDRRRAARHRHPRHRAAESPLRPGRRRRTLPAAASPPRVERKRAALDGLGAQARQAAGAQSPAARRHRHHLRHQHRQARPGCPTACATCSRSTPTRACRAKRRAGSSARWRIRSIARASTRSVGRVVEGYAILQPRVAFSLPVTVEASPFQRVFSGAVGRGSVRRGGLRRLPGLVRRRLVRRQGHLRHRCLRSRARRPRAGKLAAVARSVRRHLRARRPRLRRRSGRGISGALRRRLDAPAPLGARRLAAAAVDLRPRATRAPPTHGRGDSRMPLIGLWKMLDNLRRSLSAPASRGRAGGRLDCCRSSAALPWCAFIVAGAGTADAAAGCSRPSCRAAPPSRCAAICARCASTSRWRSPRPRCSPRMLAYQAWLMCDAIGRTLWRMFVTRRHMLEWIPADLLGNARNPTSAASTRACSAACCWRSALAVLVAAGAAARCPPSPCPSCCCGWPRPPIAWRISRTPPAAAKSELSAEQQRELRLIARRTWRFFETFVTAEDNHLPPDNFQEDPRAVVAHRTSPTNIGLYLLSIVAARDFGWCGLRDALDRIEATLGTLARMHKLPRPSLQLVRHAGPAAARAALRLLGGLRQSRRAPDHARRRLPRMAAESAAARPRRSPASPMRSTWRARRCANSSSRRGSTITRGLLETAFADLEAGAAPATRHARSARSTISRDGRRTRLDAGRHGAHAGARERTPSATPTSCTGSKPRAAPSTAGAAICWRAIRPASSSNTSRRWPTPRSSFARAMEFGFLLDTQRKLLSIGYRATDGTLDPVLLRPARLRGAAGEFHRHRQGRHARAPLVPARPHRDADRRRRGAGVLVGLDVRVPDAGPGAARARAVVCWRRPAGSSCKRQIAYGAELEPALGRLRIRVQRARSRAHLSILELRRAGPRSQARPVREQGGRALRHRPRRHDRRRSGAGQLPRRWPRSARAAVTASTRRWTSRRAACPKAQRSVLVRAYMAHHQGMSIVAIANALLDGRMRERFHSDVAVQATELLLQERTPRDVSVAHPRAEEVGTAARVADLQVPEVRRLTQPARFRAADPPALERPLLGDGHAPPAPATAAGTTSRSRAGAKTRRATTPAATSCCATSTAAACGRPAISPAPAQPGTYEVSFTEDRAEIIRSDGDLVTTLEVQVSPEDDAEVRRAVDQQCLGARARDRSDLVRRAGARRRRPRTSRIRRSRRCSCAPSSSRARSVLLANRRRRAPDEPEVWASHHAVVEGATVGAPEFETDRARFIGRGRELRAPLAMLEGRALSGTVGTVLDAVFALRYRLRVPAGGTARIAFWTCVAGSRAQVLELADKHRDPERAHARRDAGLDPGAGAAAAPRHRRLAGQPLPAARRPHPVRRRRGARRRRHDPARRRPARRRCGRRAFPAICPSCCCASRTSTICRGAPAAAGARILGHQAAVGGPGDPQRTRRLVRAGPAGGARIDGAHQPGAAAHRRRRHAAARYSCCAPTSSRRKRARCCWPWRAWCCRAGAAASPTRWSACSRCRPPRRALPRRAPARRRCPAAEPEDARELEFFNGLGGFARAGPRIRASRRRRPDHAGAVDQRHRQPRLRLPRVAPTARGYTWARNSRENALTPWSNDPVTDRPGEAIYLRDEESGELWSADAGADPPRARALLLRAWLRLQPLRAAFAWHRARAHDARAARGSRQDLPARGAQRLAAPRAASR